MKINRIIYGYYYETELSMDELKAAREEYSYYLKYQDLTEHLERYPYFKRLSPQQQKKVIESIDLRATDIAASTNVSKESAVKSLIHAVMFSLESILVDKDAARLASR